MRKNIVSALSILLFISLACGTSSSVPPTVTLDQSMVETVVAGTVEAMQTPAEIVPEEPIEYSTASPPAELPPQKNPHPNNQHQSVWRIPDSKIYPNLLGSALISTLWQSVFMILLEITLAMFRQPA